MAQPTAKHQLEPIIKQRRLASMIAMKSVKTQRLFNRKMSNNKQFLNSFKISAKIFKWKSRILMNWFPSIEQC